MRTSASGARRGWVVSAVVVVVGSAVAVGSWWVRRRLVVVTVEGRSMVPTLVAGDRVLVVRRRLSRVRRGDVVVLAANGPFRSIVKRVVALPGDRVLAGWVPASAPSVVPPGGLVLHGDGAVSADSRQEGPYDAGRLLGVVVRRMSGAAR